MRVLIGVDGSEQARFAVLMAGRLLDPAADEIVLYYAPPEIRLSGSELPELVQRARSAVAETVIDDARQRLPESLRGRAESLVGTQSAAHGLIVAAEEWRVDLIVVGAHSGAAASWKLGSVSRAVVHHSSVPVLVFRDQPTRHAVADLRVLIAFDGSEASRQAALFLQRLHRPKTTSATLLSVIEPLLVGNYPEWLPRSYHDPELKAIADHWTEEHRRERQKREEELSKLRAALAPNLESSIMLREGVSREEIKAVIEELRSDLVVVGGRGLGLFERLLIGSTTESLLSYAPCSLLVVKQHESP